MTAVATETDIAGAPEIAAPSVARLLRGSSLYLVGNIAFKVVGFVMIPFYARFLSTEEYGVLNLLELATQLAAISFGLQSLGQALTRIYNDQAGEAARLDVVSTAMFCALALAGLVTVFGVVFAAPIAQAVSLQGSAALLRLAFVAMFFSSVAEVAMIYQRMRDRVGFYLCYALVTMVFNLGLNIALIGWWHFGVWGFVYSKLAVTSVGSGFLLARLLREVGAVWRPAMARALARFGGPLIVSGACYFGIHFSDRLFLAHVSRADVGVYSLAYNFAFLLSILVGDSFNKVWGVSFYSLASDEGWQARFVRVGRWLVIVLGAGAIGLSLFGRDVLVLMVPASYDPPALLLPLLVFGYFIREVGDFFNSMLLIGAGSGKVGRVAVASAVLNLGLNAALIPRYGIWGAAWATFGTWAVYCGVCWVGAWRQHRVAMHPWPLSFILLLSGACLWLQAMNPWRGGVAGLALDSLLFAGFLAVAWAGYLREGERAELAGLVMRLLARLRPASIVTES